MDNYIIDNKNLHKPDCYPIYPYYLEDPEGFYASIYKYLYKKILTRKELFTLNIYNSENEGYKKGCLEEKLMIVK